MTVSRQTNYRPIHTEEQARRFLEQWPSLVASDDAWDSRALCDALVALRGYHQLNVIPFYVACLKHPDGQVKISAIHALSNKIEQSQQVEGVQAVLNVLWTDSNPVVRGAAAHALGTIAHAHDLPEVLPLLLSLVIDRGQANEVRVDAYKGIIYLTGREGDPKYHPFNIRLDQPAEGQVDWEWIKELQKRYEDR